MDIPPDNVAATRRVVPTYAHARGVYVEAELGEVGGKDGAPRSPGASLTDPAEAAAFVAATGVDALAVAVGSSHAMTEQQPPPWTWHGSPPCTGSWTRAAGAARILRGPRTRCWPDAVAAGMTKINVSTHLNGFFTRAVREYLDANPAAVDSRKYLAAGLDALVPEVARLLSLFTRGAQ